ncbi:unnamed protein product [Amaranthus hypochondriacus]
MSEFLGGCPDLLWVFRVPRSDMGFQIWNLGASSSGVWVVFCGPFFDVLLGSMVFGLQIWFFDLAFMVSAFFWVCGFWMVVFLGRWFLTLFQIWVWCLVGLCDSWTMVFFDGSVGFGWWFLVLWIFLRWLLWRFFVGSRGLLWVLKGGLWCIVVPGLRTFYGYGFLWCFGRWLYGAPWCLDGGLWTRSGVLGSVVLGLSLVSWCWAGGSGVLGALGYGAGQVS